MRHAYDSCGNRLVDQGLGFVGLGQPNYDVRSPQLLLDHPESFTAGPARGQPTSGPGGLPPGAQPQRSWLCCPRGWSFGPPPGSFTSADEQAYFPAPVGSLGQPNYDARIPRVVPPSCSPPPGSAPLPPGAVPDCPAGSTFDFQLSACRSFQPTSECARGGVEWSPVGVYGTPLPRPYETAPTPPCPPSFSYKTDDAISYGCQFSGGGEMQHAPPPYSPNCVRCPREPRSRQAVSFELPRTPVPVRPASAPVPVLPARPPTWCCPPGYNVKGGNYLGCRANPGTPPLPPGMTPNCRPGTTWDNRNEMCVGSGCLG